MPPSVGMFHYPKITLSVLFYWSSYVVPQKIATDNGSRIGLVEVACILTRRQYSLMHFSFPLVGVVQDCPFVVLTFLQGIVVGDTPDLLCHTPRA